MTSKRNPRRGLAIIPALVCLALVAALSVAAVRLVKIQRGQARAEVRAMQAEWLAESGAALASARLDNDPSYRGETWDVPARSIGGDDGARVTITVTTDRSLLIEASTPPEGGPRAVSRKRLNLDPRPESSGGPP